ncbi:hypothetical protein CS0771_22520 [Catellatospora sp. IY07-71]|uniref:hypothetical protein n=1 Tax=Catellatospora sp. IY07-71 TaxID=2728827 RepID=UPI001BB32DD6|nr:hypothetical protein [Catellatospora sp. IY07-71]BCJ72708.1 hypothetical protein CS0771_22520 [Catellatospora sp. IY07-71]
MSERDLIDGLARLAGPVVPGEDPYARLMARHRRARRNRAAGWSAAAVLAAVAALLGPIGIRGGAFPVLGGPSGTPSAPADLPPGQPLTPWVTRLLESPTRGPLAADTAFVERLTALLASRRIEAVPGGHIKVLFVGDVGDSRIVLAARRNGTHYVGVSIFDRRGATADELAAAATEQRQEGSSVIVSMQGFAPFATATKQVPNAVGADWETAGIVPLGCRIDAADAYREPVTWRPVPGGDYIASTAAGEWYRVTCDGTVVYQGPGTGGVGLRAARTLSESELDAALAHCRGEADRTVAARLLREPWLDNAVGSPRLLYLGRIASGPQESAAIGIAVTPTEHGRWLLSTLSDNVGSSGWSTDADLGAADAVIAVEKRWERADDGPWLVQPDGPPAAEPVPFLVLAPRTARTIQVLDAAGKVTASAPLTDGVGTVHLDRPMRLRALDASGAVVGTGRAPLPQSNPGPEAHPRVPQITDWS